MRIAAILLLLCGCHHRAAPAAPVVDEPTGTLEVTQAEHARYEGSAGKAELTFTALDGKVTKQTLDGTWTLLAHARAAHAFVIGGEFEMGAWLPLTDLRYVDDRTGAITRSGVSDGLWFAMGVAASDDGRYLALVGTDESELDFQLSVLDTTTDRLVYVGEPPAPPPEENYCGSVDEAYTWGDPIDGLEVIEPGIITFEGGDVVVSYGDGDTCEARSKERETLRWSLKTLFSQPAGPQAGQPAGAPRRIIRREEVAGR